MREKREGAREEGGKFVFLSLPPFLRAPRVSLAPKTPFPFLFKRLPSRLLARRLPCFRQENQKKREMEKLKARKQRSLREIIVLA